MLTQGEDVEVHALAGRGWSISAIARHLGRDRATVRAYVVGERTPGVRRRAAPDPLEPFAAYLAARFVDDPHLWLTALFDEVPPDSFFYFVHSYYIKVDHSENSILQTTYGIAFDSGIQKDNIFGFQFHPEKSHRFGIQLFRNFLKI